MALPPMNPIRHVLAIGSCVAGIVIMPLNAAALLSPMDLKSCVEDADVAFAGTVTEIRPERLKGAIVTKVTFSDVVYAKGTRDTRTLVLTTCGGELDGHATICEDEPAFLVNKRYILLVKVDLGSLGSPRNGFSPIVGTNQGMFLLEAEGPGGPLVVRGIVGYRNGHVLVASHADPPTPHHPLFAKPGVIAVEFVPDTGRRFEERQFLDIIRKIVDDQLRH